jgi:hypothetical protein
MRTVKRTTKGKAITQQGVEFSRRPLFSGDLKLVRGVTHDFSNLSLTELSETLCELLGWKRPFIRSSSRF